MNVMQRPLFRANGGEAFPDLSGDGKVTQKDILMGRGVIPRGMEEGGLAALMPGPEAAMMQEGMADPAMMEGGPLNPAEAALAGDILGAREEGEQMGLDYLAQTMSGIDNASNTEELINSIRGKAQPLEARVQELATFVGEEDAMRTPESVLTMVQPVIMMTEEGAIDSGVGELIQGVMGDTEMSPEMGQGVGALMAQGQPAPEMAPAPMAQPVQQFYQGGAVKKFDIGGGANLGDPVYDPTLGRSFSGPSIMGGVREATAGLEDIAYLNNINPDLAKAFQSESLRARPPVTIEEETARIQKLMEKAYDTEGQQAYSDREAGLDLARAGFAFASGRDPKTGENMAGRGFLAQVGSVGQQYAESVGERLARERKGEQALRLAAVQQGIAAEGRDIAMREDEKKSSREALFKDAVEGRRLRQQGKITAAGLLAAGRQTVATIGANLFDADKNREFQGEQTERKGQIKENLTKLNADLTEAQAQSDFTRVQNLTEQRHVDLLELTDINFYDGLATQADLYTRQYNNKTAYINLEGGIQKNLQTQRLDYTKLLEEARRELLKEQARLDRGLTTDEKALDRAFRKGQAGLDRDLTTDEKALDRAFRKGQAGLDRNLTTDEKALDRDLRRDLSDDEISYKEDVLALNEEKFALTEGLSPSTSNSFLFNMTGGFAGQAAEARQIRDVEQDIQKLRAEALAQGIDQNFLARTDQGISNYIGLADQALRKERFAFDKSQTLLGALQAEGAGPQFGTTAQQTALLGNNAAIRAYAQGADVPGFDLSLNNMFGTVVLDNVGNQVPARALTPALRAAMDKRQKAGFAVPRIQGFANGGEADMSQGYLEPVTGYRFPMDQPKTQQEMLPEVMQRSYQPLITKDIEDITKATGTQEGLFNKVGIAGNTVLNAVFNEDAGFAEDTRQAKKAVETLGTIATTTLMAAIPGKDNVELQRMLKSLQVPADSFTLQDNEALDYFRLARNTMKLGIENQLDLLQNANLTRKEMTKVETDLAQMNSIQAEYDNVIKAYETKLLPSEEVFAELDKFFK